MINVLFITISYIWISSVRNKRLQVSVFINVSVQNWVKNQVSGGWTFQLLFCLNFCWCIVSCPATFNVLSTFKLMSKSPFFLSIFGVFQLGYVGVDLVSFWAWL